MKSEVEIYKGKDNQTYVEVRFDSGTVWLSQKQMADLFDKDTDTIGLHLKNIYSEEELGELATTELFSVVQAEGKRSVTRKIKYYNLDAILSIAAGLFLYFLVKNKQLYAMDGSKIITDNTLVAITIMIAESNPNDKDVMIKLIVNLMQSV